MLKTEYIRQAQVRTRSDEIPVARSTNDLDLFLSAEIITSIEKIEKVRDAIEELNFEPYAKYFQFILPVQYEKGWSDRSKSNCWRFRRKTRQPAG